MCVLTSVCVYEVCMQLKGGARKEGTESNIITMATNQLPLDEEQIGRQVMRRDYMPLRYCPESNKKENGSTLSVSGTRARDTTCRALRSR